jgi:hypothetical protein
MTIVNNENDSDVTMQNSPNTVGQTDCKPRKDLEKLSKNELIATICHLEAINASQNTLIASQHAVIANSRAPDTVAAGQKDASPFGDESESDQETDLEEIELDDDEAQKLDTLRDEVHTGILHQFHQKVSVCDQRFIADLQGHNLLPGAEQIPINLICLATGECLRIYDGSGQGRDKCLAPLLLSNFEGPGYNLGVSSHLQGRGL